LAVAVGNFDGLHRGHRKTLARLAAEARRRGLPAFVLTFTPHPEKFFGHSRIKMLQTLEQRLEGLSRCGLDGVVVATFRRSLAALSPASFVRTVLGRRLKARLVIVGANFKFGRGRAGDAVDLARMGRGEGFEVVAVPPFRRRGQVVSSSLIRARLAAADIGGANDLLGRPYEVEGDVVAGSGRGRRLGFPTANLETPNEIVPRGVFLTVFRHGRRAWPSLTNVGLRPTFGRSRLTIETHLLDRGEDLYGASVRLAFLAKLREERAFAGVEDLTAQIRRDVARARRFFGRPQA
jgi:riboflavin kinase/FMN adenylyltransferase